MNYDHLREFATVRELEYLDAMALHGGQRKAAKAMGIARGSMTCALGRLIKRAALRSPQAHDYTKTVPDGYRIKGVSQYLRDGKVSAQWVKTDIDSEKQALIREAAIKAACEEIPRLAPQPGPVLTHGNLCNVYTLTDCHVGMLAWGKETFSGDWDLVIAEKVLTGCFQQMIDSSPNAETCIIAQLGDYLHYDSAISAVTPMHGNVLDSDGRMPKMVDVAIRILRRIIDMALQKHGKVVLLLAEGNHDISSSVWLRAMFKALYENEPRIEVIESDLPYYVYKHGLTMLGWHHGHLKKPDELPILFASQFSKMWGETNKRYIHSGHRHFTKIIEHSGVIVEQHPTIATRDAYSARLGYLSERQVTAITYSDTFGQVARNTVTPEMLG
jgi:hypothetical protein